jgi:hypothetical protein
LEYPTTSALTSYSPAASTTEVLGAHNKDENNNNNDTTGSSSLASSFINKATLVPDKTVISMSQTPTAQPTTVIAKHEKKSITDQREEHKITSPPASDTSPISASTMATKQSSKPLSAANLGSKGGPNTGSTSTSSILPTPCSDYTPQREPGASSSPSTIQGD